MLRQSRVTVHAKDACDVRFIKKLALEHNITHLVYLATPSDGSRPFFFEKECAHKQFLNVLFGLISAFIVVVNIAGVLPVRVQLLYYFD
jgi:hypothetical protein